MSSRNKNNNLFTSEKNEFDPLSELKKKIESKNKQIKNSEKPISNLRSRKIETPKKSLSNDSDLNKFLNSVNDNLKWTYHDDPDDVDKYRLLERNNHFIYFMAKSGIDYINKNLQ
jgi:hypothetical protein